MRLTSDPTNRLGAAAVAIVCLLSVACAPRGNETSADASPPELKSVTHRMEVDLVLTGHFEAKIKQDTESEISILDDPRLPDVGLLWLETDWIEAAGLRTKVYVSVNDYKGAGRYTIPVSLDPDAPVPESPQQGGALSSLRLFVFPIGQEEEAGQDLSVIAEPCQVVLEDEGLGGELACPRIAEPRGAELRDVRMTWKVKT